MSSLKLPSSSPILSAPLPDGETTGQETVKFSVVQERQKLYDKLPKKLRDQVSYKHFYTDDLDRAAGVLSVKYFSLFIMYFVSLFKLETRRNHYMTYQTTHSGKEFAKAQHRTREVWERLMACYGTIICRYNMHNTLVFPAKLTTKLRLEQGPYAEGMKEPLPLVRRARAFEFASDEMQFYEELFHMTMKMLKLAFTDNRLQRALESEVERFFRSNSFSFHHKKQQKELQTVAEGLRKPGPEGLLHRSTKLASLLVSSVPRLNMKYAMQQRTPLIACQFPGMSSTHRYQRPQGQREPTKAEREYSVVTKECPFPENHRAMRNIASPMKTKRPTQQPTTDRVRLPSIPDFDEGDPINFADLGIFDSCNMSPGGRDSIASMTPSSHHGSRSPSMFSPAQLRKAGKEPSPATKLFRNKVVQLQMALRMRVSPLIKDVQNSSLYAYEGNAEGKNESMIDFNDDEWRTYDPRPEIEAIYQSMANMANGSQGDFDSFGIPFDIMADYDDNGIFLPPHGLSSAPSPKRAQSPKRNTTSQQRRTPLANRF